jgi:hypothetical protein
MAGPSFFIKMCILRGNIHHVNISFTFNGKNVLMQVVCTYLHTYVRVYARR